MTRGTMVLITNDATYATNEFNGDMYLEGHGEDVARSMICINTKEELLAYAKKFNKSAHRYPDEDINVYPMHGNDIFNMNVKYFENWFSDYLFMKNASSETVEIKLYSETGETYDLEPEKTVVLYFGKIAEDFREIFEDKEALDNLREVRHVVSENANDISFSPRDVRELATIMKDYDLKDICGVYKDRTEYAEAYADEFLEEWMKDYFNYEKLGRDIDMTPETGIVELSSGIVVVLN